jgi:hypothetical protein
MSFQQQWHHRPSAFQVGVSEAIDAWSSALREAYEQCDADAASRALTHLGVAVSLGQTEISHRDRRAA